MKVMKKMKKVENKNMELHITVDIDLEESGLKEEKVKADIINFTRRLLIIGAEKQEIGLSLKEVSYQLTPAEPRTDIPDVKISSLELSSRIKKILHLQNIFTLKDLSTYYEEEIRYFRNMGNHSYAELVAVAETHGVHIVSCMEETKELERTFTKVERAKLCRYGIATMEDVYRLSDADIVTILGYNPHIANWRL